jgi:hypothetical protein
MVLTPIRSDLSDDQLRDLLPITGPQLCERALFRLNIEMRVPFVNLLVTVAANLTAHIRTGISALANSETNGWRNE